MKLSNAFLFLATAQHVSACGTKEVVIAGSNDVKSLAESWAIEYTTKCPDSVITIEGGGSSTGAGRVCANSDKGSTVSVGSMSRAWKSSEAELDDSIIARSEASNPFIYSCLKGDDSRSAAQIAVANDGVTVVVKDAGAGHECLENLNGLSADQLRWMFSSYSAEELNNSGWDESVIANSDGDDSTHLWSELHEACPNAEIKIAGPSSDYGTYAFFMQQILTDSGNGETFREEYMASQNYEEIIGYVKDNADAISYLGFTFYVANEDDFDAIAIDNGDGEFIEPSTESIGDGSYNKLSRKIFMNLNVDSSELESSLPFVEYGLSDEGDELTLLTGFVPLDEADDSEMSKRIADLY